MLSPVKTKQNKTQPILGFCLFACFFYFAHTLIQSLIYSNINATIICVLQRKWSFTCLFILLGKTLRRKEVILSLTSLRNNLSLEI